MFFGIPPRRVSQKTGGGRRWRYQRYSISQELLCGKLSPFTSCKCFTFGDDKENALVLGLGSPLRYCVDYISCNYFVAFLYWPFLCTLYKGLQKITTDSQTDTDPQMLARLVDFTTLFPKVFRCKRGCSG